MRTSGLDIRVCTLRLLAAVMLVALPGSSVDSWAGNDSIAAPAAAAVTGAGMADGVESMAVDAEGEVTPTIGAAPLSAFDPAAWTSAPVSAIDPAVLTLALRAAEKAIARGDVQDPGSLTIIDFSRPSTEKRMWVLDLRERALLFEELVAHGRGSGDNAATRFSNVPESNTSSLGLFRTAETYTGKHGYSLRLDGLEPGVNDRARDRAIVIHGASYVGTGTAQALGRLGRSLGCPAVGTEVSKSLIDAVKGGGLVFAYYPDQAWLETSTYLN